MDIVRPQTEHKWWRKAAATGIIGTDRQLAATESHNYSLHLHTVSQRHVRTSALSVMKLVSSAWQPHEDDLSLVVFQVIASWDTDKSFALTKGCLGVNRDSVVGGTQTVSASGVLRDIALSNTASSCSPRAYSLARRQQCGLKLCPLAYYSLFLNHK